MIAIGAAGVVVFLIALIARLSGQSREVPSASREAVATAPPLWALVVLALAALGVLVVLLIWVIATVAQQPPGTIGFKEDGKALAFVILMIVIAAAGLVAYLVFLLVRYRHERPLRTTPGAAPEELHPDAPEKPETVETPSALRLLGLLAPVAAILLLMWIHLSELQEQVLMSRLVYPAAFAVALVLLFDKAARTWSVKSGLDTFREWLFCDLLFFLLVLAYFNLQSVKPDEAYRGNFWDLLFLVLLFSVFWLVDRKDTRLRFLIGYLFLVLAPILLLIWQTVQGIELPAEEETYSWWSTLWPFFFWAIIFAVLEIIALVASRRRESGVVALVKDAVFVLGYGTLLIVAA